MARRFAPASFLCARARPLPSPPHRGGHAMHPLTGYADRWSVKPGGRVAFRISSAGGRRFRLRVVRHLCAAPNPDGPGYHEVPMPSSIDGEHQGEAQGAWLGSFGHAPALEADLSGGVSLTATIWPTTPGKGR